MKTTLVLVRHGQSEANLKGFYAGHTDADLTETGLQQAEKTAEYVVQNYTVDKIYASDLKRAFKTAQAVGQKLHMEVIPCRELREIDAGDWEGLPFETLQRDHKEAYGLWLSDIGNSVCTGGESVKELGDRILRALTDIAEENPGKTVLVGIHATPIRVMQCLWSGLPLSSMQEIPWVSNASVTEVVYEDGNWELVKVGYDAHLAALKTHLPTNV
ncbi:MAG: histidine phosphatase family protein [Clostridia bacterium]|nr:histidine phosphatase family protein [Clostridia bacterium]